MRKNTILFILVLFLISQHASVAETAVYSQNDKFGLKNGAEFITNADYRKLIRLGSSSWIMQDGAKFGVINDEGIVLVKPVYTQAERILGKFVKFRKGDKYGIYDETGFEILPVEYSSIDLLYGGMFVTCKNFKYGATDLNGQVVLENIFDDIYTPDKNKLILVYQGKTLQIEKAQNAPMTEPFNVESVYDDVTAVDNEAEDINPLLSTGYYGVTLTDYILKLFSSISPAYEQTIDELVYSQGADTVNVLMKFTWLPKFPFVYARKYYNMMAEPYSGPFGKLKRNLKNTGN